MMLRRLGSRSRGGASGGYVWHLHGLGWHQLTDTEKAEVLEIDTELRRLASLARDHGCPLLPSERESTDHLPGDVPPSMTPK